MNKFRGCRACQENNGFLINHNLETNELEVTKCKCLITFQNMELYKIKLKEANIPMEFESFSIDSYIGSDKNNNLKLVDLYIKNFKKEFYNYHLYFYGDYGTQKTYISKYIISELLKQELSCYYVLADQLIKILIDIHSEENMKKKEILLNKDFLVIDELSDDKCTIYKSDYQIPYLTSFLKERLENKCKSTLFISNHPIDTLYESKFSRTIADLINRECKDKLLFEDNYYSINKSDLKNISSKLKQMMGK